jgi:hypothetical protein
MIYFNADHKLAFKGHYFNGERLHFNSLSHFILCEPFYLKDKDYYKFLCELRSLTDLKAEVSINTEHSIDMQQKQRILLTGLHFSITQNKSYFDGFQSNMEDIYTEDPEFNLLINSYRKRYHTATNTRRLFLYSEATLAGKEQLIVDYLTDLFIRNPPEEVVLETNTSLPQSVNDLVHQHYLPIQYIKSEASLSELNNIRSVCFANTSGRSIAANSRTTVVPL